MHAKLDDWKNGWMGLELGISRDEIDELIRLLRMIREDPDQHFHITSDYEADGGLGDITLYLKEPGEEDNLRLGGRALAPGESTTGSDG